MALEPHNRHLIARVSWNGDLNCLYGIEKRLRLAFYGRKDGFHTEVRRESKTIDVYAESTITAAEVASCRSHCASRIQGWNWQAVTQTPVQTSAGDETKMYQDQVRALQSQLASARAETSNVRDEAKTWARKYEEEKKAGDSILEEASSWKSEIGTLQTALEKQREAMARRVADLQADIKTLKDASITPPSSMQDAVTRYLSQSAQVVNDLEGAAREALLSDMTDTGIEGVLARLGGLELGSAATVDDLNAILAEYVPGQETRQRLEQHYDSLHPDEADEYRTSITEAAAIQRHITELERASDLPEDARKAMLKPLTKSMESRAKVVDRYQSKRTAYVEEAEAVIADGRKAVVAQAKLQGTLANAKAIMGERGLPVYVSTTQTPDAYTITVYLPVKAGTKSLLANILMSDHIFNDALRLTVPQDVIDGMVTDADPKEGLQRTTLTLPKSAYDVERVADIERALRVSMQSHYDSTPLRKIGVTLDLVVSSVIDHVPSNGASRGQPGQAADLVRGSAAIAPGEAAFDSMSDALRVMAMNVIASSQEPMSVSEISDVIREQDPSIQYFLVRNAVKDLVKTRQLKADGYGRGRVYSVAENQAATQEARPSGVEDLQQRILGFLTASNEPLTMTGIRDGLAKTCDDLDYHQMRAIVYKLAKAKTLISEGQRKDRTYMLPQPGTKKAAYDRTGEPDVEARRAWVLSTLGAMPAAVSMSDLWRKAQEDLAPRLPYNRINDVVKILVKNGVIVHQGERTGKVYMLASRQGELHDQTSVAPSQ